MDGKTTIQVQRQTREILDSMKIIDREPYDAVIRRVIGQLLDQCEEGLDPKTKKLIQDRLQEVHRGQVMSTEEIKKALFEEKDEVSESLGAVNKK